MTYYNHLHVDPKTGLVGEGVKFERVRRITGYLVGTLDRFNNAKKAEVEDRVKHLHVSKPQPPIEQPVPQLHEHAA